MATAIATTARHPNMNDQTGPRKRRKRTTAAGAAADCFTCASRNARCDRRRPYCTQCLEAGQDCAGYKLQLTWGVGVASRGKLRGLSLPVAGTAKVEGPNSLARTKKRSESDESGISSLYAGGKTGGASASVSDQRSNAVKFSASEPRTSNVDTRWAPVVGNDGVVAEAPSNSHNTSNALHSTKPASFRPDYYTGYNESRSTQAPSLQSQDVHSYANHTMPYLQTRLDQQLNQHLPIGTSPSMAVDQMPFSYATPFLASPELLSFPESPINSAHSRTGEEGNGFSNVFQSAMGSQTISQQRFKEEYDEEVRNDNMQDDTGQNDDSWLSSPFMTGLHSPLFVGSANQSIGKTPRMQYLINYYAEVISPVIVAFDNASNPFRFEILRLAANSESLQHAIAALSTSNLRQRRGIALSTGKTVSARRSSMAHVSLTDANNTARPDVTPESRIREETYHKRWAVTHLNEQLADSRLRKDDSILAILLVLCLFHICDSGVARFQTQFAGVKKLLTVRGDELGFANKKSIWMTRLFTWFDALAATVNDRESQFPGLHLEMDALSGDWSLESLAGIDGRLFKTIAKLGRLNMLRQGMSVASSPLIIPKPLPVLATQTPFDPNNFDGNGWVRITADENLFSVKDPKLDSSASHEHTNNTQFWREWREIRHELQMWSSNDSSTGKAAAPYVTASGAQFTAEQVRDLHHISNAFRYAGLLYTERLASPSASASSEAIQLWVRNAITHIQQVQSDVFLLWTLFITGSECVTEADRDVIRGRCVDIQKDSGFVNNRSCLDLLEKLWAKMDQSVPSESQYLTHTSEQNGEVLSKSPFRFREVMLDERNEGEYIVV